MSRPRKHKRWEGIIGIGDRVAFKMPGERWITAGHVLDITVDQQTLTIENIAGMEGTITRRTTLTTVGGKPMKGPTALTITIQRGLVIENKTEVRRLEARESQRNTKKRGKYAVHTR